MSNSSSEIEIVIDMNAADGAPKAHNALEDRLIEGWKIKSASVNKNILTLVLCGEAYEE